MSPIENYFKWYISYNRSLNDSNLIFGSKNHILRREAIMPTVVMYENEMLMGGNARFFTLRELGIRRVNVYYSKLKAKVPHDYKDKISVLGRFDPNLSRATV